MKLLIFSVLLISNTAYAEYQAEWINRHEQLGYTDITLILKDDEGILPDVRIDKNFHRNVTDRDLEEVALEEIEKALTVEEEPIIEEEVIDFPEDNAELPTPGSPC